MGGWGEEAQLRRGQAGRASCQPAAAAPAVLSLSLGLRTSTRTQGRAELCCGPWQLLFSVGNWFCPIFLPGYQAGRSVGLGCEQ